MESEDNQSQQVPSMPELNMIPQTIETGEFQLMKNAIIPGFANKADEVRARFCSSLLQKHYYVSKGIINYQEFIFALVELEPGKSHTIIATRIEPQGNDLYIEWRHFVKDETGWGPIGITIEVIFALLTWGLTLLLLFIKPYREWCKSIDHGKNKQKNILESSKYLTIVRAVLRESLIQSGVSLDGFSDL
jgi:hypothetical protein